MKKSIVTILVLGLIFASLAGSAEAKKKKAKAKVVHKIERVVEIAYTGGNAGVATPAATGGSCFTGTPVFTCQSTPSMPGETFVKIEVTDASGQKAGGFISQGDENGDGVDDGYGEFCGAHSEPVALTHPGEAVDISLYPGVCSDASGPSVVTTGTIKVTFSNMP